MEYNPAQREKQSNTIKGKGNPNWRGGKITKTCIRCGSPFYVYPSTSGRTHCSLTCANRDMADAQRGIINPGKIHYGEDNGSWNGGKQTYICQWCGDEFQAYSRVIHKYCSYSCNAKGSLPRLYGEEHPNWKGGTTAESDIIRHSEQYKEWRTKVFTRDNFTCQKCGKPKCYIEAHHTKPFALYPELRFEVDNGITLCEDCHNKIPNGNQFTNNFRG